MTQHPLGIPPRPRDWHDGIITDVCDGDTVRAQLRLGLGIEIPQHTIRLIGVQAPELNSTERLQAQQAAIALSTMVREQQVIIHAPDDRLDRYGRLLAIIYRRHPTHLHCINRWLIANGYAESWAPRRHKFKRALPPEIIEIPDL